MISPLLSNIYLDPLDHRMAAQGWKMVRYADDFVLLCRSQAAAEQALRAVQDWTAQAGLTLYPEKTRVVDATQKGGFDFLGYHFERGYQWPRAKSLQKMKDRVRVLTKVHRTVSCSEEIQKSKMAAQLNDPVARGRDPVFRSRLVSAIRKGEWIAAI